MRFFALTATGRNIARSVNLPPDKPATRVLYYLDKRDQAADEAIANGTGLGYGETIAVLRSFQRRRPPIAVEVGGDDMSRME